MALTQQQRIILEKKKEEHKIMNQVSRIEKDISTLEKRLEIKQEKLSTLIEILDGAEGQEVRKSVKTKEKREKSLSLLEQEVN